MNKENISVPNFIYTPPEKLTVAMVNYQINLINSCAKDKADPGLFCLFFNFLVTVMTFPTRLLDIWLFILQFYSFIQNYILTIKSEHTLFIFSQDALEFSKSILL